MSVTTRLSLPYPSSSDGPDGADVPYWVHALAVALDGAAMFDYGLHSARPAAPVNGFFYWETDTTSLFLYANSAWHAVNQLADGSVSTAKIADDAVTAAKIATDAVGASEIVAGAVGTGELADGAVTAAKVADALKPSAGASGGTEALRALGTAAGTAAAGNDGRLADNRTPSDGSVSTAKIADGAVTSAKIADGTIATADLADGAVTSAKIADGTIVAADIANDTITATQIAANAVGASELADNAVDTAAIAAGAVTEAKMSFHPVKLLSGGALIVDCGSTDALIDSNGQATISFNGTFPTGVIKVNAGNGDGNTNLFDVAIMGMALDHFVIGTCLLFPTGPDPTGLSGQTVKINWDAFGY